MKVSELFGEPVDSNFVGERGKRQEFVLKLNRAIRMDQGYAMMLYIFSDLSGNQIVWFASKVQELDEGAYYCVRATVKYHREYRGTKQTVINRLKILGPYYAPLERTEEFDPDDEWTEEGDDIRAFYAI